MQTDPLERLVLGSFLIVAGLILVIFHKAIRQAEDSWNDRAPWFLQSHPRGRFFEILLILFGVLLIFAGIVRLVSAIVQH
jgi:hypothetical protein